MKPPAWMAKPMASLSLCLLAWVVLFVLFGWLPWWLWKFFLLVTHE